MLINADKSINICKLYKKDYQKHLQNNIKNVPKI